MLDARDFVADGGGSLFRCSCGLEPMQRLHDLLSLAERSAQLQLRGPLARDVEHHTVHRASALRLFDHDSFIAHSQPAPVASADAVSQGERLV